MEYSVKLSSEPFVNADRAASFLDMPRKFGTLYTEPRKSGPDVWVYRWRETNQQGSRKLPKQILGQ